MEELQKTQEYGAEQERRREQLPYQGEDRRRRATWADPVAGTDSSELPVSAEDGTGKG